MSNTCGTCCGYLSFKASSCPCEVKSFKSCHYFCGVTSCIANFLYGLVLVPNLYIGSTFTSTCLLGVAYPFWSVTGFCLATCLCCKIGQGLRDCAEKNTCPNFVQSFDAGYDECYEREQVYCDKVDNCQGECYHTVTDHTIACYGPCCGFREIVYMGYNPELPDE